MPSKKEIFLHVKTLETQKASKGGLNAEKMWIGTEQDVTFQVAKVNSLLIPLDSLLITGERDATFISVAIKGETEGDTRGTRRKFVSAFGSPFYSKIKESPESIAPNKPQETILWIEKEALVREGRKPLRVLTLLNRP